ncbi:hypothetical protein CYMTET_14190 [Cymbomonas tetramitiformis]|uniref:peptidylprolyl isomerase n=1 Tax=Cymbomonas tetramitiformis TaxID=36881 RepID=A0AAE0GGH7_9CHLO|nr:hypothetical protein CYMTET_14190 [Cymbomonas tetramitiformis]
MHLFAVYPASGRPIKLLLRLLLFCDLRTIRFETSFLQLDGCIFILYFVVCSSDGSALVGTSSVTERPAKAVRNGAVLEIDPVEPFELEDFTTEAGWEELDSGLLYKVVKKGEGDRDKGIFDKVDHFQPFPFVTVQYTAWTPDGRGFASSYAQRRPWTYQVGVRQEVQDEDGAVMSMVVGERRQFVVPFEIAFKRKLFGELAPQNQEALLIEVELLGLQPY